MGISTREGDTCKGVRSEVLRRVFHRTEVIESLEENRHVDAHDAAHEDADAEDRAGEIDREAGVCEECIEEDADRLTARGDAKGVEKDDEEKFCGAWETNC